VFLIKTGEKEYFTLAFGPPIDKNKDNYMAKLYVGFEGKKAVCGGTTAKIIARELNKNLEVTLGMDCGLPPKGKIDGIDIVTEGLLTLSKTAEIIDSINTDDYKHEFNLHDKSALCHSTDNKELIFSSETITNSFYLPQDPAEELVYEIIRSKYIRFIVGQAENPANKQFNLPIKTGQKLELVNKIKLKLEKMGKKVEIIYF
jgi:hypothetical protein